MARAAAAPRPLQVTERDVRIIRWVWRMKVLQASHVARAVGTSVGAAHRRCQRLVQAGLLRAERPFHAQRHVYVASPTGCALADRPHHPDIDRPELGRIRHTLEVASVALDLLESNPGASWRSERELRAEHLRRRGPRAAPHMPDGVLVLRGGGEVAVEVDLSDKGPSQLRPIVAYYARSARYQAVRWFVARPGMRERIAALVAPIEHVAVLPHAEPDGDELLPARTARPTPSRRAALRVTPASRAGRRPRQGSILRLLPRGGEAALVPQARDLEILRFLARMGCANVPQIARATRSAPAAIERRCHRLRGAGLLVYRGRLFGQCALFTATRAGGLLARAPLALDPGRPLDLRSLQRRIAAVSAGLDLEAASPGSVWISERQLRREAVVARRGGLGRTGPGGGGGRFPDGALQMPDGQRVAVCVDLAARSTVRLLRVCERHARHPDFDAVRYLVPSEAAARRLALAARPYSFVAVEAWAVPPEAQPRTPPARRP